MYIVPKFWLVALRHDQSPKRLRSLRGRDQMPATPKRRAKPPVNRIRSALRTRRRQNPETALMNACLEAVAHDRDCVFWRSNTGMLPVAGKDGRKRFVRFGLAKGSSDLIGIVGMRYVNPNMTIGRFAAIEVKMPGGLVTPEQDLFLQTVRHNHGFATVISSVAEMLAALRRAKEGLLW